MDHYLQLERSGILPDKLYYNIFNEYNKRLNVDKCRYDIIQILDGIFI